MKTKLEMEQRLVKVPVFKGFEFAGYSVPETEEGYYTINSLGDLIEYNHPVHVAPYSVMLYKKLKPPKESITFKLMSENHLLEKKANDEVYYYKGNHYKLVEDEK